LSEGRIIFNPSPLRGGYGRGRLRVEGKPDCIHERSQKRLSPSPSSPPLKGGETVEESPLKGGGKKE